MHRLFIDIPLNLNQQDAIRTGIMIMKMLEKEHAAFHSMGVDQINFRLGHDEDRQNRNYFVIDDMGHASTKKSKIRLDNPTADGII